MKPETKNCQNCKKDFVIESDDFGFYEKIKVPPPTFCPECRLIRRFASTNERVLYKRKCDLTNKDIFSMYPEAAIFPVYETDAWYSDKWNPYEYAMDYDFSRSFFDQFHELFNKVPRMALVRQGLSLNSPYAHRNSNPKNSYMVFRMTSPLDCLYCYVGRNTVNCVDCFSVWDCELCYECIDCNNCYKVRFSQESHNCRDSFFLYSCRDCYDCIGCVNLISQSYCIFNKKYSKEEYFNKLKELKLNSVSGLADFSKQFEEFRKTFPHKSTHSLKSYNVSGNWLVNCQNVKNSIGCIDVKDGKHLFWVFGAEDCMDYFQWGNNAELVYESENCGMNISRISFCNQCWMGAHDLLYCDSCPGSSFCFGCVGLKKGEYSILNKKYSKEEYQNIVFKIIDQMEKLPYIDRQDKKYFFGEYFPTELSPFAYNETAAVDFFPISEKEVVGKGYKWKNKEKSNYNITIKSSDLPETVKEVKDSILQEVIECGEKDKSYSVGVYKITQNELNFYRKMDLPLPRVCFDARHTHRLEKRQFIRTIKRNCSRCEKEVDTVYPESYAPILYCEKCYQQEIY